MIRVKNDILQTIEQQVEKEITTINQSAEEKASRLFNMHKQELSRELTNKINQERTKAIEEHDQKLREIERSVNLNVEKARYEVIERVFSEVKEKIINILNSDILSFVNEKINEVDFKTKDLTILVSENDFANFSKQLAFDKATNKCGNIKKYNVGLAVSKSINNGFIIVGKDFDVNYTIDILIDSLKEDNLTKVYKGLFTNES